MSEAQAKRLRALLLDPAEAAQIEVAGSVPAGVLAPLFELAGELHAIFTKRPDSLRLHAGQVSFPGGRREPTDSDLIATALREAHEEIGLDPAAVTIVGALEPTPVIVNDFAIYPVVGLIDAPAAGAALTPAAGEVEAVIEVSLRELAATHRLQQFPRANGTLVTTDAYTAGEHTVWGATARIVTDLLERLSLLPAAR